MADIGGSQVCHYLIIMCFVVATHVSFALKVNVGINSKPLAYNLKGLSCYRSAMISYQKKGTHLHVALSACNFLVLLK